jgi:RNA polymerase sigma-70 factor (ECF subfamily)
MSAAELVAGLGRGDDLAVRLDGHRRELRAHCRRILGSGADADDAVQETLIRAWRHADRFEGRSSLRTWLYRIATNVCIDLARARGRRAEPVDLGRDDLGAADPALRPAPAPSPEQAVEAAEDVRRAFALALAHLPATQRAAVVLYDVFRWPARDVADLMGTTPAAVASAVQRARVTLAALPRAGEGGGGRHGGLAGGDGDADRGGDPEAALDEAAGDLLGRYVDAFRAYDLDALATIERRGRGPAAGALRWGR